MSAFRTQSLRRPIVAALLSSAIAVPALAADVQTTSIQVGYGDLNLSSREGVNALRHRLVIASRTVCGDADNRDLTGVAAMRVCQAEAMNGAMATLRRVVAAVQSHQPVAVASAAGN